MNAAMEARMKQEMEEEMPEAMKEEGEMEGGEIRVSKKKRKREREKDRTTELESDQKVTRKCQASDLPDTSGNRKRKTYFPTGICLSVRRKLTFQMAPPGIN